MKIVYFIIIFFVSARAYSSEKQIFTAEFPEFRFQTLVNKFPDNQEKKRKHRPLSMEKRMIHNLNLIFVGSCLLSYSSYFFALQSFMFTLFLKAGGIIGGVVGALSIFCVSSFFLMSFISGLIFFLTGNIKYHSRRKRVDPTLLTPLLEKKRESLQKMALISGIVNGAGLVFGGAGAGMICGGWFGSYQEGLFVSGIVLAAVGGTALAVCLPMMITSLAMSGWLKGEINRLSLDVSFVPEEKNGARGSSLSPWENNRLSLALKVRF